MKKLLWSIIAHDIEIIEYLLGEMMLAARVLDEQFASNLQQLLGNLRELKKYAISKEVETWEGD